MCTCKQKLLAVAATLEDKAKTLPAAEASAANYLRAGVITLRMVAEGLDQPKAQS